MRAFKHNLTNKNRDQLIEENKRFTLMIIKIHWDKSNNFNL